MEIPRIMLAGVGSGSGKTLVTCALLAALKKKGYRVQAWKCGPDYIDPMFHRLVLETGSGNLDPWFCDGVMLRALLAQKGDRADISVLEGVMGYYDGLGGTSDRASSYEVAAKTGTPVILVVDAKGMSKSLVPLIRGFAEYRKDSRIAGVIFNRMKKGMYPLMKQMVEEELAGIDGGTGIRVLGYVPELPEGMLESRHLGLVLPQEVEGLKERMDRLGEAAKETLDLDGILKLAAEGSEACEKGTVPFGREKGTVPFSCKVRIGVARDRAFCFLYPENVEVLEAFGAEPVYFSPLEDEALPEGICGLVLSGGYPELHAGELEANTSMRRAVREALDRGMPCLAECGGFLYLQELLEDGDGKPHRMAEVLAGHGNPKGKLVRFGYVELEAHRENLFLEKGEKIRGHEFHYWDSTDNGDVFLAKKASGRGSWECMRQEKRILAGFPHLYYYSNPKLAGRFVQLCREYQKEREGAEGC